MLKMLKYLKKSTVAVITIVLLLVIQATCDLSLPDYTSNIVNVGIQQGGVEDAVPSCISEKDMDKLTLFMEQNDKDKVLNNYKLIKADSATKKEKDKYPILKNKKENVYELKKISDKNRDKLSEIMGVPDLIVATFSSNSKQVKTMKEQMAAQMSQAMGTTIDADKIDLFETFSKMPEEQFAAIRKDMVSKFDEMSDSIVKQSATTYVKSVHKTVGINVDKNQSHYILRTGAIMVGISLIALVASVIVGLLAARVAAGLGRNLRFNVFSKVLNFSNTEMDRFSTASLITRSTNDIQQIQMLMVMLLRIVFYAPILGIGGVLKVLKTNSTMTWIIGLAVAIIMVIMVVLYVVVMPKFKIVQKMVDKLNLVTREILTGLPVIRAFSTEKHEEKRFDKANIDLTKLNLFVNRTMALMMPLMMFIMNGIAILIVWKGAHSIDAGTMQVGDMLAFIYYTMQIIMSFLMITMLSVMLPRASISAKRIDEVITTELVIKEAKNSKAFVDSKKGLLEFKNVSFKYPNASENVIEDITFTAKPGETTAIIGSTGAGKSTLINLIPRFYDVSEGEILVDGVDVRDVSQHNLREKLGYVPQKGVLFSGTIDSNLRYGNENASKDEIEKAAEIAQADEFIDKKPEKFDTPISQGGTNVSGGQKQRLSIARAIATHPEIYIFDDSFSALDFKTDAALRAALKRETGESTVLIVAQRISTILHADQILVLDEGKIVGKGTHKELLENCEVYKEIASSQLSKEELENE